MPVLAPGGVGLGEAERGQVGHCPKPDGGGVLRSHCEDQIAGAEAQVFDMRFDFAGQLLAELEAAVLPIFGILLD